VSRTLDDLLYDDEGSGEILSDGWLVLVYGAAEVGGYESWLVFDRDDRIVASCTSYAAGEAAGRLLGGEASRRPVGGTWI
jgi:hypothetical protein